MIALILCQTTQVYMGGQGVRSVQGYVYVYKRIYIYNIHTCRGYVAAPKIEMLETRRKNKNSETASL